MPKSHRLNTIARGKSTISSVVVEEIYAVLKSGEDPDPSHARYYAAIEQPTAAIWHNKARD